MKDLIKLGKLIADERDKENVTLDDIQNKTAVAAVYMERVEKGEIAPTPFVLFNLFRLLPGLIDRREELYRLAGIIVTS